MNRQRVVPIHAPGQLTLTFEPGVRPRVAILRVVPIRYQRHDVVRKVAYGHPNPLKTIAADMDMSQSTLSRKLAQDPDDPRRFTLDDLERFITATGDATVVEYLAAKYLQSDEARRAGAVVAAEGLLRELAALLPTLRPE